MAFNWTQALQSAAQIASAVSAARGQGKAQQAAVQQQQDAGSLDRFNADAATDLRALEAIDAGRLSRAAGKLAEYEAGLNAPQARASNAVRGDILANVKSVRPTHARANVVDFTGGGLSPDLLSGNSRALGREMSREALLSQLGGTPTPYSSLGETDFSSVLNRTPPTQTPLPQESAMDKILAAIGTYGSLAGAVMQPQNKPTVAGQAARAGVQQPVGYQRFTPEQLAVLNPQQRGA